MTRSTVAFGCRCPAAAAVLVLTVTLVTPTPLPGRTFSAPDVLRDISGERAYSHVVALSEKIGPHPAGTHEDRASGEYIAVQLEGVGERLQLVRDRGAESLVLLAQQNAEQLGIKAQLARSPGSDHVKFEHAGIPVVFLFRPDDLYNHTPKDTIDRVDAKLLEISARLATAIVVSVSRAAR